MCTAPATERNRTRCLTHENVSKSVALQVVQFILACYIILRYIIIKHSEEFKREYKFIIEGMSEWWNSLEEDKKFVNSLIVIASCLQPLRPKFMTVASPQGDF
jgi:hypothetical protein